MDVSLKQIFFKIKISWNNYWFAEGSSVGYGLFRIGFGIVLFLFHAPRIFFINALYTADAFLVPTLQFRLLHLPILPFPLAFALVCFILLAICCFIFGYRIRLMTVIILVLHLYFTSLERFSTKGFGDIITIYVFLSLFVPAQSFFSLDDVRARIRTWRKNTQRIHHPPHVSLTIQRVMLWQLALIYLFNVTMKLYTGGMDWFNGKHLANIYGDPQFLARAYASKIFLFLTPILPLLGLLMIGTLAFIGIGLLLRNDRPYAIVMGVVYHGVALVTLRIPFIFSLLMFSLYIIAMDPEWWDAQWQKCYNKWTQKKVKLFYDDNCQLCRQIMIYVASADLFDRIICISLSSVQGDNMMLGKQRVSRKALLQEMHMKTSGGSLVKGFFAFRAISQITPFLWPFMPFLYIPGMPFIGKKIYAIIARNRTNICLSCQ